MLRHCDRGREKAFVAGADIKEMDLMEHQFKLFEYMTFANNTLLDFLIYARPTIMVLNGYTLGGGMELALSTDIRIDMKTVVGFPVGWALFQDSVLNVCRLIGFKAVRSDFHRSCR